MITQFNFFYCNKSSLHLIIFSLSKPPFLSNNTNCHRTTHQRKKKKKTDLFSFLVILNKQRTVKPTINYAYFEQDISEFEFDVPKLLLY